tara:strand:- start:2830 stop:3006 length:177 start_codon:yes stop_codon:yes gene_type:complete
MGAGATDQNGSYKLEFLKIKLPRKITRVAVRCANDATIHKWFVSIDAAVKKAAIKAMQ